MSSNRRGRRVPPKARGPRPDLPSGADPGAAGAPEPAAPVTGTRAANRAAKRAALGVRPKTVRRGHIVSRPSRRFNPAVLFLAIAAVAVGAGVLLLGNPFGNPIPSPSPSAASTATATQGAIDSHGDGTCPTSQPPTLPAGDVRTVTIETEMGDIVMRIDPALAPIASSNFVALVSCHFYDGIVFHRLMPGFVIQGGDPRGDGSGDPGYEIKDDPVTTPYRRGTVAMARQNAPDTQGSQFFVVLSDEANETLSGADFPYAIMGEVTSGMDVVDAIAAMPSSGGQEGRALEPVVMTRVTVSPATAPSAAPSSAPNASSAAPSPAPTT